MRRWYKGLGFGILVLLFMQACEEETGIGEDQASFFVKFYGTSAFQEAADVKEIPDNGGYVILGTSDEGENGRDITVIQTDKFGNQQWAKTIGDTLDDFAGALYILDNGNYAITGTKTLSDGSTDLWYGVLNPTTRLLETDTVFGDDENQRGTAITVGTNGDIVLVGSTTSEIVKADTGDQLQNPAGIQDIFILGLNSDGDSIWSAQYGGVLADYATGVVSRGNGGYVVFGTTVSRLNQGVPDFILIDITSTGLINGPAEYGNSGQNETSGNIKRINGDIVAIGSAQEPGGSSSVRILRFNGDNIGDLDLDLTFSLGSNATGLDIADNNLSGVSFTGSTRPNSQTPLQTQFMEVDASGNTTENDHLFGGTEVDGGVAMVRTIDGGYAIVGTSSFGGNSVIKLIKLNSSGKLE